MLNEKDRLTTGLNFLRHSERLAPSSHNLTGSFALLRMTILLSSSRVFNCHPRVGENLEKTVCCLIMDLYIAEN